MRKSLFLGVALSALALGWPAAAELKFEPGKDASFTWANYDDLKKVDLKGETLSIFGPWRGEDEALVRSVLEYFSTATGGEIKYSSSENYEQQIVIDTQAGSPPNIAILPQPGLIQDLASKGLLMPLGDEVATWVKDNYGAGQSWVDLGTYKDKDGKSGYFAFPYKADVKSLVWYSPENFEEAGYEVPKTQEEMAALEQKIMADGGKPWCIGLGSGGATGWPATDWVEDIMLRTQPPEVYDKWVEERDSLQRSRCRQRHRNLRQHRHRRQMVDGGGAAVAATDFRDSPKGLFGIPPKCYLHRQASFISSFFPEGTKLGEDADFFYLPAYAAKPELGAPVLGAGTLVTITKDSKAAREFIKFLQDAARPRDLDGPVRLPYAVQVRQQRGLCQRRVEEAGRDSRQRLDLPLRRFGPDAGQDRRGRLLDRNDRPGRRQARGRRRGQHPEELGRHQVD